MGFRDYINKIDEEGYLRHVEIEVSKRLEISGILKEIEPTPVIFNHVKELMDALKENRHFIIGPSTVIYEGIPYRNVEYFIEASRYFGKYQFSSFNL